MEVQNTFYEPPRDSVMKKWLATTAPSLEYTIKVWQKVTHAADSPAYRRITRPLPAGEERGYFRDSPPVEHGWQCSVECADLLPSQRTTPSRFSKPWTFTYHIESSEWSSGIKRRNDHHMSVESAKRNWPNLAQKIDDALTKINSSDAASLYGC